MRFPFRFSFIVPSIGMLLLFGSCSSSDLARECPPGLVPGDQGICIPAGTGNGTGVENSRTTGGGATCDAALAATLRINEVLYQHPGSDQENEFIELIGPEGANLRGYRLEAISGANANRRVTLGVNLSGTIGSSGLFVVGGAAVPNLDQDFGCGTAAGCLQNNAESVVLLGCDGEVVDALGYGPFESTGRVNFGLGSPAPAATAGRSLSRCPGQPDSRDNATDFGVSDATPGTRNAGFVNQEFCDESAIPTSTRSTSELPADAPCLRISEYIEGTSNNKAFAIQSCSSETLSLNDVGACVITNDATTCSTTLMLRDMELAAGAVTTVCNTRLDTGLLERIEACDLQSNVAGYNGDDRLLLFLDRGGNGRFDAGTDLVLDAFGETRVRPDSLIWSDTTLKRCRPDRFDGQDAFVAADWFTDTGLEDFSTFGEPISFEGCEVDTEPTSTTDSRTDPTTSEGSAAAAAAYCLRISHFLRGGSPANRNKAVAVQSCSEEDLPLDRVAMCRLGPSATEANCTSSYSFADAGSSELFEAGSVRVICHEDLAALPPAESPLPDGVVCDHVSNGLMGYGDNARFLLAYSPDGSSAIPSDARSRGLILDTFGQTNAAAPDGASWTGTWVRCNEDAFDGAGAWPIEEWFRQVASRSDNDFSAFASDAPLDGCDPSSNGTPTDPPPTDPPPTDPPPTDPPPTDGPDVEDFCVRVSHFVRGGTPANRNKALAVQSCSEEPIPLSYVNVCRFTSGTATSCPTTAGSTSRVSLAEPDSEATLAPGEYRIFCHSDLADLDPAESPLPEGVSCDYVENSLMGYGDNARFLVYFNPEQSTVVPEDAEAQGYILDAFGQSNASASGLSWTGTWVRCNPDRYNGLSPWTISDWFTQIAGQSANDFSPLAAPAPMDGCPDE